MKIINLRCLGCKLKTAPTTTVTRLSIVTLIHVFVTGRLDYCNSLMYGLPQCQISKSQRVQNAAARIALELSNFYHITPALRQLH